MDEREKLRQKCKMCLYFIALRESENIDGIEKDCNLVKEYVDTPGLPRNSLYSTYGIYTVEIDRQFKWVKFYCGAVLLLEGEDDARDYEDYASLIYSLIQQTELAKAGIDVEMIGSIYDVIEILDATE